MSTCAISQVHVYFDVSLNYVYLFEENRVYLSVKLVANNIIFASIVKPRSKDSAEGTEYQDVHSCPKLRVLDSQSSSLEYTLNSYK